MKVTALAGGVGGAKLLVGLQEEVGDDLTAVVNTGDDDVIYGVHVSPDVDIVTYWLAGVADTERGWGLRCDTFEVVESLRALGTDAWFSLGDRDLATCIYRTERMRAGATLSDVTRELARSLGVTATLLPMSDDEVRTRLTLRTGEEVAFQDYFVRLRHEPDVASIRFMGADHARPAPGVEEALSDADVVVVCPSNPLLSVGPILALPGVRALLKAHPRVICVSPIVGGRALKGPADRLMRAMGMQPTASAVAETYGDFCDVFVADVEDVRSGLTVPDGALVTDTVMRSLEDSALLARTLLNAA